MKKYNKASLKQYLYRLNIFLCITCLILTSSVSPVSALDERSYMNNSIYFLSKKDSQCEPGQSNSQGYTTIGDEVEVGVSIYGGTWDGKNLKRNPGDDNGNSLTGKLNGRTVFAELSNARSADFRALTDVLRAPENMRTPTNHAWKGGLKPKAKLKITYGGKTIVMEKGDVGTGGGNVEGKVRAVDLWYETAKLLDFRAGTEVAKVQLVSDDTPVTPLDGQPVTTSQNTNIPMSVPDGSSTGERVFKFLLNKGLSRNQALGIVANLMQESGGGTLDLKPDLQNNIGAYGIAQWLGGRRTGLQEFAKKNGMTEKDFVAQVNYLWDELNDSKKPYKSTVLDPIKTSSTLAEAVTIFLERFEIPCLPGHCAVEIARRMAHAATIEAKLAGVNGGGGSTAETCEDGTSENVGANADGYALPIIGHSRNPKHLTCTPRMSSNPCHHDGTPAFDLIAKPGTKVVAITNGVIDSTKPYTIGAAASDPECKSIQFKGDDGWYYWYGHTTIKAAQGTRFKAGQVMGVVGSVACGMGGASHLHIDRGFPKGRTAGEKNNRDNEFVSLMQKLLGGAGGRNDNPNPAL